jgi:hypothetical protein
MIANCFFITQHFTQLPFELAISLLILVAHSVNSVLVLDPFLEYWVKGSTGQIRRDIFLVVGYFGAKHTCLSYIFKICFLLNLWDEVNGNFHNQQTNNVKRITLSLGMHALLPVERTAYCQMISFL